MVKVTIDQDTCVGCGVCVAICGEVFKYGTGGAEKIQIAKKYQNENASTGEVPNGLNCLERAVRACQLRAITAD